MTVRPLRRGRDSARSRTSPTGRLSIPSRTIADVLSRRSRVTVDDVYAARTPAGTGRGISSSRMVSMPPKFVNSDGSHHRLCYRAASGDSARPEQIEVEYFQIAGRGLLPLSGA
jgi:hypothetical protein